MQGLSRGLSGQSLDCGHLEQLQSQLQQRSGQLQKLNADLEYSQEELQDLQRHCRSLEVCECMPISMPSALSAVIGHAQNDCTCYGEVR